MAVSLASLSRQSTTMDGLLAFRLILIICTGYASCSTIPTPHPQKLELFKGFTANIPDSSNGTDSLISFDVDLDRNVETGRGSQKKLLQRVLPMFVLPFLIQSMIIPLFLGVLKFMLFKSLIIGKLALVLIIINAFRNSNSFKGRDAQIASVHYGHGGHGIEEYAALLNNS